MRRLLRPIPILIVLAVLSAALFAAFYAYVLRGLPSIDAVDAGLALPSTRIYDRNMRLLYEITPDGIARNSVLPLDEIPPHCVNALIATEDAGFYGHPGVSVRGIARAAWLNLRGGDVVAGGSTITQQVARNLLLDPNARAERTLQRKLREMVLAVRLQQRYSKDEVLALWLNQTDFGNLAYGVDAAARAYFGKSASALSLAECSLLVGVPQSPNLYDPLTNLDAAKVRQRTVLDLMTDEGYITEAEADTAHADELQFAAVPYPIEAPHAVMAVWRELEATYPEALYNTGLEVVTTFDLDWHNAAQRIVARELERLNNPETRARIPANAHNAAVVALDPYTGEVRVMLGSPDFFDDNISGAVNLALTPRQPGSTLKPFTYAAAMNPESAQPYTAATVLMDVRTPFITRRLESYVPANFDLQEHGPVRVREALGSSFNIPAVIALEDVGVTPFIQLMTDMGVEQLALNNDVDLSVTLGGGEVRLLNLAGAYGALANGGTRVQPALISSITTADGDTLYEHRSVAGQRVLDERVAFIVTDMLADDGARHRGFGANSLLNIGRPAAAKTGTTTDFRDNWVLGYTPELVVGVWVGNASYEPMQNVTGLSGAGPIWHRFIREVTDGTPRTPFTRPDGVERVDICALSGMLPTDACTVTRSEWFITGTAPTEPDDYHQFFEIDTATGQLATAATPPERRTERVYVVLPPPVRAWGARNGIPEPPALPQTQQSAALRIVSPDPYTTYEIDPVLPRESQRVKLAVSAPLDTVRVTYRLNGEPVAVADAAPYEAWWQLAVGEYTLTAEIARADGGVETLESVPFTVVPYQAERLFTP
ncbi:MAG: transglycosylase domain-containing protein [Chloroflexota bacterium]